MHLWSFPLRVSFKVDSLGWVKGQGKNSVTHTPTPGSSISFWLKYIRYSVSKHVYVILHIELRVIWFGSGPEFSTNEMHDLGFKSLLFCGLSFHIYEMRLLDRMVSKSSSSSKLLALSWGKRQEWWQFGENVFGFGGKVSPYKDLSPVFHHLNRPDQLGQDRTKSLHSAALW